MPAPATKPPRLHFVTGSPVAGLAVAERRVERPEGCVVCVHGALDRGGSFARLVRRLDTFDVVVYDRRGYQGSRDLAPVDLVHHVDDLVALAEREAQRQPVMAFGHSFGGVVTIAAALRSPTLFRLVVNYESPLPWLLRRPGFRPALSEDAPAEAERFFRRVMSDREWSQLSEQQRDSRRQDGPALLSDLATVQNPDSPFDLSRLHVPLSYVHGDGTNAEYYRALGALLVEVNPLIDVVELTNAGHAAHLKNPDQLAEVIGERWWATCASA